MLHSMTRRRWIADEFVYDRAALTGPHAAHLARILRARIGQEFEVVCGDIVRRGSVATVSEERVEFVLGEEVRTTACVPITLLLAVFKFDRMEWAIEKCTELNVTSIVPVIVRRTDKHLVQAAEKRVERWRRIAREASEQARRVAVPEIGEPKKLSGALDVSADLRIVLAETKRDAQLNEILHVRPEAESLALAIGPEGGWAQDELQWFKQAGWIAASLGPTILRAETAAIAAMAVARGELG
jgi:16S rRNA (uracil1498-N3)-methyltransferase